MDGKDFVELSKKLLDIYQKTGIETSLSMYGKPRMSVIVRLRRGRREIARQFEADDRYGINSEDFEKFMEKGTEELDKYLMKEESRDTNDE